MAVLLVILSVRKREHELVDQWANEMEIDRVAWMVW